MNTADLSEEQLDRLRERRILCLADHGVYGVHERLAIADPFYLTVLRDPIDSFVSSYYFLMRSVVLDQVETHLDEYRDLFGAEALSDVLKAGTVPAIGEFPRDQLRRLAEHYREPLLFFLGLPQTQVGVDPAKTRLREDYGFVGILERFDDSMELLSAVAPSWLRLTPRHIHRNPGSYGSAALDEQRIELIQRHRRHELEIYRFACRLFDERSAALGSR